MKDRKLWKLTEEQNCSKSEQTKTGSRINNRQHVFLQYQRCILWQTTTKNRKKATIVENQKDFSIYIPVVKSSFFHRSNSWTPKKITTYSHKPKSPDQLNEHPKTTNCYQILKNPSHGNNSIRSDKAANHSQWITK